MTDKERLEEIKGKLNRWQTEEIESTIVDFWPKDIRDVEWLIAQAERVQDLEKQNKRYREALEFYADKGTYEVVETLPPTDEYQQPIEPVFKTVPIIYYDKGKEARKALEGEE